MDNPGVRSGGCLRRAISAERQREKVFVLCAAGVVIAFAGITGPSSRTPEQSNDKGWTGKWLELTPTPDPTGGSPPAVTYVAVAGANVAGPREKDRPDAYAIEDLRSAFILEKREVLVGEPVLIEFRTWLDGPGTWWEPTGGAYRFHIRDNNFLFLARDEEGQWLPEIYYGLPHGGLCVTHEATQETPHRLWLPVQRWCPIERPGRYDVFCFYCRGCAIHEVAGCTPLLGHMPKEIHALREAFRTRERKPITTEREADRWCLDLLKTGLIAKANAYACLKLTVREGTHEDRKAMVEDWLAQAEGRRTPISDIKAGPYDYQREYAVEDAIYFTYHDDFLPVLEQRLAKKEPHYGQNEDGVRCATPTDNHIGIFCNRSVNATRLALRLDDGYLSYLTPETNPKLIENLTQLKDDEDPIVRERAAKRLAQLAESARK
ncbi:MAG TPA: hypothetical protein PLO37_26140 [Candidatus Hydrogenedentes bacterium]|nr:hypothetical protein [Candidatus Hydrogenedentota bacterium]